MKNIPYCLWGHIIFLQQKATGYIKGLFAMNKIPKSGIKVRSYETASFAQHTRHPYKASCKQDFKT